MKNRKEVIIELVACGVMGATIAIGFYLYLAEYYLPSIGIK